MAVRKIVIEGIVQGVGFRPFAHNLAREHGIRGTVANVGGAVEIIADGENLAEFLAALSGQNTPAKITNITAAESDADCGADFRIIPSAVGDFARFVPPDISVCEDCLNDMANTRRAGHFFCSCARCGPRYTVIESLPYDRETTAMSPFPLCPECAREYETRADRRFRAETTCCNDCGPELSWLGGDTEQTPFETAVSRLKNGEAVMVKGIGGYHLACSPFDGNAVAAVRRLKHRDEKPLAVMFRDAATAREYCFFSENERELLTSSEKPIVPLTAKRGVFAENLLNGDAKCGAFLPYSPLHALLLQDIPALTLTSANVSGEAIITDDRTAANYWRGSDEPLFAGVLAHNRAILRSAEDSVAQINLKKPQILRRSRGFAPSPVLAGGAKGVFAAGGDLKSAFALSEGGRIYQSPYFGDLEDEGVFARYAASARDLRGLLGIRPTIAACDMHPAYVSADFARKTGLPTVEVQHHHAHAASVMAEHALAQAIAVCFDGTGCGEDGAVWGGEFLTVSREGYARAAHLGYVKLVGGDAAAKNAAKTLGCYLINAGENGDKTLAAAIKNGVNTAEYSSAGRLFDAVSAALGLCSENAYEGLCAIRLQQAAERALSRGATPINLRLDADKTPDQIRLVREIYGLRRNGADADALALGFHIALSDCVGGICAEIAAQTGIRDIALTGGVFQNALLTRLCADALENAKLKVYINREFPPNDNGLALGQSWIASWR